MGIVINMDKIHLSEIGDTLVEVLLATAVLSVVMAGAFTLTNKATRLSQTADERTQVSNLMQAQVELIKAKHSISSDDFWAELDSGFNTASENTDFCDLKPDPKGEPFQVKTVPVGTENELHLEKVTVDSTTGEITSDFEDLYNVWVEAVDTTAGGSPIFTDFFVYACWEGIGDETLQRSGLIMRLTR